MIDKIQRVAALQLQYSCDNTAAMKERGDLIRRDIPAALNLYARRFTECLGVSIKDLGIEGKDGIGRKTQAPWVRLYSKELSPKATIGFYVVIHFSLDGERCYVTVGCASTRWDSNIGDLVKYSAEELQGKKNWAMKTLTDAGAYVGSFQDSIVLGSMLPLPKSFEKATILAKEYSVSSVSEEGFVSTIEKALALLKVLYDSISQLSDLPNSEIDMSEIERVVNPNRLTSGSRQGFGLSPTERKAVELRAMEITERHLKELGYTVINTSSNKPYDFLAKRACEEIKVEVKGTTSSSVDSILMTSNEVKLHQEESGKTSLSIVSGILLRERGENAKCEGGVLEYIHPWDISKWIKKPISYQIVRS